MWWPLKASEQQTSFGFDQSSLPLPQWPGSVGIGNGTVGMQGTVRQILKTEAGSAKVRCNSLGPCSLVGIEDRV